MYPWYLMDLRARIVKQFYSGKAVNLMDDSEAQEFQGQQIFF
jgi:hypothetical protein